MNSFPKISFIFFASFGEATTPFMPDREAILAKAITLSSICPKYPTSSNCFSSMLVNIVTPKRMGFVPSFSLAAREASLSILLPPAQ